VELDTRQDAGYTVSLEWDRDTDNTQIVVADSRTACLLVFPTQARTPASRFAIGSGTCREHCRRIDRAHADTMTVAHQLEHQSVVPIESSISLGMTRSCSASCSPAAYSTLINEASRLNLLP
jgi:hypothetical protein